jgi:predicted phosphodiesterase
LIALEFKMSYIEITVPKSTKIAVVGDIHEHDKQFYEMLDQISPSEKMWIVSVGDVYNKGYGKDIGDKITDTLIEYSKQKIGYAVKGNHEIKNHRLASKSGQPISNQLNWFSSLPLAISFIFENRTRLTVVHGGVTKNHTWKDLKTNNEMAYVRTLNPKGDYIKLSKIKDDKGNEVLQPEEPGVPWHEVYDGRFGYIASGHNAQHDGIAKFYGYSCNLDSACYDTGVLSGQIFSEDGLDKSLRVVGEAFTPGKRYW